MTVEQPDNLRNARKESRASRRALGADAVEEKAEVKVIRRRKAPVGDPTGVIPIPAEKPVKVNPRMPTPQNPQYTRIGYATKEGQQLYEATGSSGQIAVRSSANTMTCGIDVADIAAGSDVAKTGQVWTMFPSTEAAERKAAKLREQGFTVTVVPARPYGGQPGDPA